MINLKANILETKCLLLKPVVPEDFDRLFEMYRNKAVMQYIYDGSLFSEEDARSRVEGFIQHWSDHGFGMWMMFLKETAEAIGYAGFRYFSDNREAFKNKVELGYIIDQPYWGKGYAKECMKACVEAGMKRYKFSEILATILPDNIASARVATHAGLHHAFDVGFNGLLHHVYELKKTSS